MEINPGVLLDGLAAQCNVSCQFCYVKGSPPDWIIKEFSRKTIDEEIDTRLKYYDEDARRALFPTVSQYYETFVNARALEILRRIRSRSKKWFAITTNGKGLTEEIVAGLAELQPLYITLSLNSHNPALRSDLMKDSTPEVAIRAVHLLREYRIPFAVSHVPWPTIPIEAVKESILYAAEGGAQSIRVSLPGYTKYSANLAGHFDTRQYWTKLVQSISTLRQYTDTPIVFYPYLFEESVSDHPLNQPVVVGIGHNSPAAAAGFRYGDVLHSVNGQRVISRSHARTLLYDLKHSSISDAPCTVRRNGEVLPLLLEDVHNCTRYGYPYGSVYGPTDPLGPFGLYIPAGFKRHSLTMLKRTIRTAGARRVMVVTSQLMNPLVQAAISEGDFYKGLDADVHFVIPENRFLGGGIFMGDLLVNADIIDATREFERAHGRPDLICIPASMFTPGYGWKRDLNGRYYKEIERTTGIPVRLIPQEPITW